MPRDLSVLDYDEDDLLAATPGPEDEDDLLADLPTGSDDEEEGRDLLSSLDYGEKELGVADRVRAFGTGATSGISALLGLPGEAAKGAYNLGVRGAGV